ncbi:putative DNA-binding regulatory protein [Labilithrix luteola]|uniref:Putative DNA-binding regulatory protein n=1 Tax=Labilithrix luteola TaxID=1391654 RepID=A0A0K1PTT2_9BACT|nr:putative DNA-binding regulatory protein [Labilithrix luteola]
MTLAWDHARSQFPGVEVSEAEFRAYLLRHNAPGESDEAPAQGRNPLVIITDLYLACACSRGDARAIAAFEHRYSSTVESVRLRFRGRAPSEPELWAELAQRLFVRTEDKPAKIAEFSGRSELGAWLKVVTSRIILNRLQAEKPEASVEDRILEGLLVTQASPELSVGRAEHRALMSKAFALAASELPTRERRILRQAFAEGFTIDDLASLYNVHRSTAARWIKDATNSLSGRVATIVRTELRLSKAEYESWARDITSSMDVSIAKYLATRAG